MYKPEENICEDFDTPQKERNMCMSTPLLGVEGTCKHAAPAYSHKNKLALWYLQSRAY